MSRNVVDPEHVDDVLARIGKGLFTTSDFVEQFRSEYPEDWKKLVRLYGHGGARSGRYYTPHNYLGIQLSNRRRKGLLKFNCFTQAPDGWGNSVVAQWKR